MYVTSSWPDPFVDNNDDDDDDRMLGNILDTSYTACVATGAFLSEWYQCPEKKPHAMMEQ